MFPPVAPETLSENPGFARLHHRLTRSLLADDCSTHARNLEHGEAAKRLHERQVSQARECVLVGSLHDLAVADSPDGLPLQLRELVYNICAYLLESQTRGLRDEEHTLMQPEVDEFLERLSEIATALSTHLCSSYDELFQQALKAQLPVQSDSPPDLVSAIQSLKSPAHTQRANTVAVTAIDTTASHLASLSALLTSTITRLERQTHGTQARYSRAHAEHLAAVAGALSLKVQILEIQRQGAVNTEDLRRALDAYREQVDEEARTVRDRERQLTEAMMEYEGLEAETGQQKPGEGMRIMNELGKKYREICGEIEEVKDDLERLDSNTSGISKRPP